MKDEVVRKGRKRLRGASGKLDYLKEALCEANFATPPPIFEAG